MWLGTHPGADALRDPRFNLLVDEMRRSWHGLIDPRIVAADGSLYDLPSPEGRPVAAVADREYFTTPLMSSNAESGRVYISAP